MKIDPEYLKRQKPSLVRTKKQVILFNKKEMAAIDEYCRMYKIKSKSSLFRQAIMERVLSALDENHPTLF